MNEQQDQQQQQQQVQQQQAKNQIISAKNQGVQTILLYHLSTTPAQFEGLDKMSRLYVKGRITGHQRGKHNSHPRTTLLKIEGVEKPEDTKFYLGKRVAYVYKAPTERRGSKVRVIWGKVTRAHGNSGAVRSKFRTNIPPKAFGASVRIMLYPSSI